MKIYIVRETTVDEKRVALVPDVAKKFIKDGFDVFLEKDAGHLSKFTDKDYSSIGVNIDNNQESISDADVIFCVRIPEDNIIDKIKSGACLIGLLNPYDNKEKLKLLSNRGINAFSMELIPRSPRAQSMDVLSSQSNLAGYRAVVDCVAEFEKAVPMMMTAAGTVPAAKVLVIGAGVAGLQAIATAKRLGAIVSATDVRAASKEQVESLGGKFLTVEQNEDMETAGGYAKEASDEYKKKQAEMMKEALKKNDIVICTALIPGKPAPRILTEDLVKLMKPGSIVYDLAAEQGGNSAFSEAGKINSVDGIKIIGVKSLMNSLPLTASSLYAKNLFSFIRNLYSKEKKDFNINLEDEIIEKSLIKRV